MQQITDVCVVCMQTFIFFPISPLFKWLEAQCATRYHHLPPKTPSIATVHNSSTVNMRPKKKRNFEKVIQFSDFSLLRAECCIFSSVQTRSEQIIANGIQIFIVFLVTNWWKTFCENCWFFFLQSSIGGKKVDRVIRHMQNHFFFVVAAMIT